MHKHFKMSDESSHHLFYHHHKIAIFIAVFVTIILCVIILIQIDFKQNNLDNAEQVIAEQKNKNQKIIIQVKLNLFCKII